MKKMYFKPEDEIDGIDSGKLVYEDGQPYYPDGRWVLKTEAVKIARKLKLELEEIN